MPFTANKNLETPANGAYVGTWDVPVNSNTTIIDASFGGVTTIALTNAPVTLSAAQYQNTFINFSGALSGDCAITFPAVGSFYTIQNLCTNSSAFIVTLLTTAAGAQTIGCPFGEPFDIMTDGTNVKFKNFGRIGTYWDYGGSSSPRWCTASTIQPYLNCDGTAFSSATYPILATILGGTTLPDLKGRARSYLNQGTSRLLSTANGVDGNTLLAGGGGSVTLVAGQMPMQTSQGVSANHTHDTNIIVDNARTANFGSNYLNLAIVSSVAGTNTDTESVDHTHLVGNVAPSAVTLATPTAIGGISMIRSG